MSILVTFYFFKADCQKKGFNFPWGMWPHKNYSMVVILLSFLCNYDNVTLNYIRKNVATQMKDGFLLADAKLAVYHEWVKHLKKYQSPSWVWRNTINKVI